MGLAGRVWEIRLRITKKRGNGLLAVACSKKYRGRDEMLQKKKIKRETKKKKLNAQMGTDDFLSWEIS